MSVITNYAASPLTVCKVNKASRIEFKGWNIASGVPTDHVVSGYCDLCLAQARSDSDGI